MQTTGCRSAVKVRRSDVLHAFEVVLAADNACQTKLRQDVQQLQHNNDSIQGSEHLDGSRQTALGCDVGEQTCDVNRNQRNDNAAEYAGNDLLQIAENVQQGIAPRFAMPMPSTNANTSAVITPNIGSTVMVNSGSKALLSRASPVMG